MTATSTEVNPRAAIGGRELRRFTVQPVEVREASDGSTINVVGYASVTNQPYTVSDMFGDYEEVVRTGAFTKTLAEKDDVRLLLNHDGIALARTKSGTLTLSEIAAGADDPQGKNQTGLWINAGMDSRSNLANDVKVALERGDMDQMSIAFQVTRQEWSPDYSQRDISEMKLFDVSVVTYPASPTTSVGLRAADIDRLDENEARELLGRLQARFAPKNVGRDISAARFQVADLGHSA